MSGESKFEMQCAEFDALLADALDGVLTGEKLSSFQQHKTSCKSCGALFAETESGLNWMNVLDEVEPPKMLVHNILAATSGTAIATGMAETAASKSWIERMRERMTPHLAPIFTSRFAMSFGMAFFSFTLLLNFLDIKVSNIRKWDLTPRGISRTYTETEARVVKYYDNIRLVYEIESRVRELRRAAGTESNEQKQPEEPKDKKQNNSNSDPEQRREQNYSRGEDATVMAVLQHWDLTQAEPGQLRRES